MVVLAEDEIIRECLSQANVKCHTVKSLQEDGRYVLHPAKVLSEIFSHLGLYPLQYYSSLLYRFLIIARTSSLNSATLYASQVITSWTPI